MTRGRRFTNVWLALALGASLIAAEKDRAWQTGQVAPSKSPDARIQYIAGQDKTYIVRGEDLGIPVGGAVRFAVQGSTMYVSLDGKEYKLTILGATVKLNAAPATAPVAPPAPVPPPAPAPAAPPAPTPPPEPAPAPPPATTQAPELPRPSPPVVGLDNDAVVKMIVGGLKEDTVIQVIQSRPGSFNLAPAALDALRAAGVPQSVIAAVTAKMNQQR